MIAHKMNVVATTYCIRGTMANGKQTHAGAAATDPQVISPGTIFTYKGRRYRAEDTGDYIKGHRVDLWDSSCKRAIQFGVHHIRIRILPN